MQTPAQSVHYRCVNIDVKYKVHKINSYPTGPLQDLVEFSGKTADEGFKDGSVLHKAYTTVAV